MQRECSAAKSYIKAAIQHLNEIKDLEGPGLGMLAASLFTINKVRRPVEANGDADWYLLIPTGSGF